MRFTLNNLAGTITPGCFSGNYAVMYDGAQRVNCWQNGDFLGPVWWGYYGDGNRRYTYSGYNPIRGCAVSDDPGPWYTGVREGYFYTGQKLTRREWRPYTYDDPGTTGLNAVSTYSYDGAGDLTQEVHVDYTSGVTTTQSYNWQWQGGTNRLTTFTASNGVTTTLEYDGAGRIRRRATAQGYSDYLYQGESDWLARETWHSSISGNVFDLVQYGYTHGRPSWAKVATIVSSDQSAVWEYGTYYLQSNWHGDVVVFVNAANGDGGNSQGAYDPWGNPSAPPTINLGYYRWNGGWGYLKFDAMGLYYVHGRWYNPDTGRFISPDEKGEYLYGSGEDAINWAWIVDPAISLGKSGPVGYAIVVGGGGFFRDTAWAAYQAFNPPPEWTLQDRIGNAARATLPVVGAEGIVTLGPMAAQQGVAYLGRSLFGRIITGGATVASSPAGRRAIDYLGSSGNGMTRLYRAVSEEEFQQIMSTRTFQPSASSMSGKWFALTAEDAGRWGEAFMQQFGAGKFRIISIDMPNTQFSRLFAIDYLDNIGPAVYAELSQLQRVINLTEIR